MAACSLPPWLPTKPSSKLVSPNQCLSTSSPLIEVNVSNHRTAINFNHFQISRFNSTPQASRKISNYYQEHGLVSSSRNWGGDFDDEDEVDEEEDDRSLDLLVRFIQNVFKKISRRARNAVRSILPPSIPTKLVGFSVNGIIILAFLWVLKAFLEVVCTIGSMVFVSILTVRGIWSGLLYFHAYRRIGKVSGIDDEDSVWTGAQPAT